MGGAPTLLMMAILGVTYGWQPDGNQGVEYIIQIPPQQLAEIERKGEISSTIDPAVRGHVSKVIVRVGTAPLPRTMPPGITRFNSPIDAVALADHVSIPIPESGVSLERAASISDARESAMKPQNIPSQGLSLPPSLSGGAASGSGFGTPPVTQQPNYAPRTPNQVNAAAGRFGAAPNGTVATGADASNRTSEAYRNTFPPATGNTFPPATGHTFPPATGSNVAAPPRVDPTARNLQFTGDTGLARPRTGGPSTDPFNQRDNAWNNPTSRQGSSSALGAATPKGAAPNRSAGGFQAPAAQDINRFGQSDTTPRSTSNFAQLPNGMTLPGNRPPDATAAGNQRYPQTNQSNGATPARTRNGQLATGSQQTAAAIENPFPARRGETQMPTYAGQSSPTNFGSSTTQPQPSVAPQTSAVQQPIDRPPGTWSVNAYGQPVNQQGQVLDRWGNPVETVGGARPVAREQPAAGFGQGSPTTPVAPPPNVGNGRGGLAAGPPPRTQPSTTSFSDVGTDGGRRLASQRGYDGGASDPRTGGAAFDPPSGSESTTGESSDRGQTVTAQPLFNGLLLISIVANVYLIFWLKNLRHQFRDMVTAKRVAGSGVSSA
jgi:hypothetical protein